MAVSIVAAVMMFDRMAHAPVLPFVIDNGTRVVPLARTLDALRAERAMAE